MKLGIIGDDFTGSSDIANNLKKSGMQVSMYAGIPNSKPAHVVNQVCGSGLRAVISGYQSIKLGDAKNVISGGQENMSMASKLVFNKNEKKICNRYRMERMDFSS